MTAPEPADSLSDTGFHEGELAVQERAGVAALAAPLARMVAPSQLRRGVARFLAEQVFAAVTARDASGRLWTSPLTGPAGFLVASGPTTLRVDVAPAPGDPLHGLPAGQPAGLLVIDLASRHRVRINGRLTDADPEQGLQLEVEQAFGNCPQYIQQRRLEPSPADGPAGLFSSTGNALDVDDTALVRAADTFVIGTTHPTRGNDTSHRGGPPGFVRVEDGQLWWPDYHGNNTFTTMGNLDVDPTAALLFLDFTTGTSLHLSGQARVEWSAPGAAGDDDHTGRRVRFTPEAVTRAHSLAVRAVDVVPAPDNPPLTG